jgi:hypothetical protein
MKKRENVKKSRILSSQNIPTNAKRQTVRQQMVKSLAKGCQLTALPRGFEFRANAFFRRRHFLRRQTVFLKRIIRGNHFHGTQRHNLALKHKANVFSLRRFFEPVAEPPAPLGNCKSLHTLMRSNIIAPSSAVWLQSAMSGSALAISRSTSRMARRSASESPGNSLMISVALTEEI